LVGGSPLSTIEAQAETTDIVGEGARALAAYSRDYEHDNDNDNEASLRLHS
jgi:hypothetical protein